MKAKHIFIIFITIVMGFFIGKFYVLLYGENITYVFDEKDSLYFLCFKVEQEKKENDYVYELESDGYHVYLAIVKDHDLAYKLKDIYEKEYNNVDIERKIIDDQSFINMLSEYEKIISIANGDDIKKIEKIILSNYKEMVLKDESYD